MPPLHDRHALLPESKQHLHLLLQDGVGLSLRDKISLYSQAAVAADPNLLQLRTPSRDLVLHTSRKSHVPVVAAPERPPPRRGPGSFPAGALAIRRLQSKLVRKKVIGSESGARGDYTCWAPGGSGQVGRSQREG